MIRARKEKNETANIQKIILEKITEVRSGNQGAGQEIFPGKTVLAHWQYSRKEWERFLQMKRRIKKRICGSKLS